MRADARRNREKLLAAAASAFAEAGTAASLEAIAKQAGVGIGTLYRHFPTREALIEAAYANELDRLCDVGRRSCSPPHPPDVALAEWMDGFVDYAAAKRGMSSALQAVGASDSEVFAGARGKLLDAIALLLAAGVDAGTLRSDVDAEDVLRAMGSVWQVEDPEQARTLFRLLMDGLRFGT